MSPSEKASWELEEGAEIAPGRTILEPLGGGSRYEVHLVWDDRWFAVMVAKIVRPDQASSEHALEDLRDEAELLGRLAHPVLLRGFDAVLDGPYPHVLVEHLEGPTLRRLIRRGGPLPMPQLLPLALHVAAALHYMSTEDVVHLDVKPDNIVMGVPPRLIDLSVARSVQRARELRRPVGTDAYMAPEQCDPKAYPGDVGPPADVFGLAATLHHAASGSVPFPAADGSRDADDLEVRFPQLVDDQQPLPASVPDGLCELIEAGLKADPADRPTAAELALGLEPLVAALPKRAPVGRGRF